jgi:hypothetical protein
MDDLIYLFTDFPNLKQDDHPHDSEEDYCGTGNDKEYICY